MDTRKEKKERRRQEILYAALELFVTKGYAATKITDIAKSANMSRGLEGTAYPGEQKCEHVIDFFMNFTEELFAYMKEQPVVAKFFVLMAEAQRSEATPEHIREIAMRVNVIEQFVPIVEWGQKEGTIKEGSPLVLSNAFWCSVQGIAERFATNQDIELPNSDWIVDIIRRK